MNDHPYKDEPYGKRSPDDQVLNSDQVVNSDQELCPKKDYNTPLKKNAKKQLQSTDCNSGAKVQRVSSNPGRGSTSMEAHTQEKPTSTKPPKDWWTHAQRCKDH